MANEFRVKNGLIIDEVSTGAGTITFSDGDVSTTGTMTITSTNDAANAIYLRANAGTSETIKIHADQGSGAGSIELTSDAGGIDINAAGAVTMDAVGIALGAGSGELDLTTTGTMDINSAALDIDASGAVTIDTSGGASHIAITSAHTADQAILISANANSGSILDMDAGILEIDTQKWMEFTTTAATGHILFTCAHTSGVAFHIDANANAASEVQIDAGILDIDVTGATTIDGVGIALGAGSGELDLTTTGTMDINSATLDIDASGPASIVCAGAASDIVLTTVHTAGMAFQINANTSGTSELEMNAGILDVNVTGATTIDGVGIALGAGSGELDLTTTGTMDINSAALDIDTSGAVTIDAAGIASHVAIVTAHTAGDAFHLDANADAGSIVKIDAGILDLNVTAGVTLDGTTLSIDGTDDSNLTVTGSNKDLNIGVTGGSTQELNLTSAGTGTGVTVQASAGDLFLLAATAKDIKLQAGQINVISKDDAANAIKLTADQGTSETIVISAVQGTADAAILLDAAAGGLTLRADAATKRVHIESTFIDTTAQATTFQFIGGSGVGSGSTTALRFLNGDGENHLTFDSSNEINIMGKDLKMADGGKIGSGTDFTGGLYFKANGLTTGSSTQNQTDIGLQVNAIDTADEYAELRVHVGVAEADYATSTHPKDLAFVVVENSGGDNVGAVGYVWSHGAAGDGSTWGMGTTQGNGGNELTLGHYDGKSWDGVRGDTMSPFDTATNNDKQNLWTVNTNGQHTYELGSFKGTTAVAGSVKWLNAGTDNTPNVKVEITSGGELRFYEHADSLNNYIALKAPNDLTGTSNYTLTLPVDDGTSGQVLSTDGSGALSWATASSGGVDISGTDHRMVRMSGTDDIQDTGITVDDSNNVSGMGTLGVGAITTTSNLAVTGTITGDTSLTLDAVTISTAEIGVLDGATQGTSAASKAMVTDSSGDILMPDSDKFELGASSDMTLYHDATNSYITNKTGALKIATETSGIAVAIGHTISETTINDNLTVTGDLTVSGTTTTINTATIEIEDNILNLNRTQDTTDTATAATSGIEIYRGDGVTQASLIFDESDDTWDLTNDFKINGTSASSSASTGSLIVAGGAGIAADLYVGDDLRLRSDSSIFAMGLNADDFSITHDGDLGATIAGSPITITAAEASTWSTSAGALTLTSAAAATWSTTAGILTLDGDDGIQISSTATGNIDLDSIADIVLDVADDKHVFFQEGGVTHSAIAHGTVEITSLAGASAGATAIDVFDCTVYQAVKYLIVVEDIAADNYMSTEILVLGDENGGSAVGYMTTYAVLFNNAELGVFTVSGSSNNISLNYNPTDQTGTDLHRVRVVAQRIASLSDAGQ